MNQIRLQLEKETLLNDNDWQIFSSKLIREELSKKQVLLEVGQIENYLSFVESGIIRVYLPKEENDLTVDFAFDGSFVSGYSSFLTRMPSIYQMEALTETRIWRISYDDLQLVYDLTEMGDRIGRKAGESLFLRKSKRELSLLNDSAENRYLHLFTEQPKLIQLIPLKYIASYIGVTPQALSRIRRRIS